MPYETTTSQTAYMTGATDKTGRVFRCEFVKTYFNPIKKISQFLKLVKFGIPLQDVGSYEIDCKRVLSYTLVAKKTL